MWDAKIKKKKKKNNDSQINQLNLKPQTQILS